MEEPIVKQILVGADQVFSYLVSCPATHDAILVDAGGDPEKILAAVEKGKLRVRSLLCTHGHADHLVAAGVLKQTLGVPVGMHEADASFFHHGEAMVDLRLQDRQILPVGRLRVEVLHTPGHTPGSACFLVGSHLFTGDTLFVGAAGRTDFEGGSLEELLTSIRDKILTLPGQTIVWPGHDYGETPASTLKREKRCNVYITDFLLDDE